MKGRITYYYAHSDEGRIVSEDGQIYSFTAADTEGNLCQNDIKEEVSVSFHADDLTHTASAVAVVVASDRADDSKKFDVPSEFLTFDKDGPDNDYELIDSSPYTFKKECRNIELAKEQLESLCEQAGANALIDFKVHKILKNSIGFSYYLFQGQGRAAVIARPSPNGEYTKKELRTRISHKFIAKIELEDRKRRIIGKISKVVCGVLLIIFIIGFAIS
ncbi:MAG: hypothetical protein ACI4UM_07065 [Succinivibrio sp.]